MDRARGPLRTAPPYSRFRCLACRVFVRGTEAGHCPRCGFVPPTAIDLSARAVTPDRSTVLARWPIWIGVGIVAIVVAVVATS